MKHRRHSQKLVNAPRQFASVKDIYINEGIRNAELKCKVLNEHTNVEWLRNNSAIHNNQKYEIINRGNDRVLLIKNPSKVDDGDYICQSDKHRVVLNLNVNPCHGGITPHMYSSEDDSVFIRNNTKMTSKDTELVYYDKQSAALKCEVKFENEPVVWIKDNSYLPRNEVSKYAMVQEGPYRVLNIKNLNQNDNGNYFCQSENNKESTIGFKLNIKCNLSFFSN